MGVTVKIPGQLRAVTGGEAEAVVDEATTVGEVLDGLYDRFDGLKDRIAEDGDLRRFVNVYVQGEDIRFLDGLDTTVEDGDEVTILPAVVGGWERLMHTGIFFSNGETVTVSAPPDQVAQALGTGGFAKLDRPWGD